MKSRLSRRNPLFRRLSRHAGATTLFRYSLSVQRREVTGDTDAIAGVGPCAQAFILPQPERLDFFSEENASVQPARKPVINQPKPSQVQQKREPSVPSQPVIEPVRDPVWRRLQNILSRHQEAEGAEREVKQIETPSPDLPGLDIPSNSESAVSPHEIPSTPRAGMTEKHSEMRGIPQKHPSLHNTTSFESGEYPERSPKNEISNPIQRSQDGIQSQPVMSIPKEPAEISETIRETDSSLPVLLEIPAADVVPREQSNAAINVEGLVKPNSLPSKPSSTGMSDEIPLLQLAEEPSFDPQPLPLESVWPVQSRAIPAPKKADVHPVDVEGEIELAPFVSTSLESSQHQVERILKSIAPGDQTNSGVEVITPRRLPSQVISRKKKQPHIDSETSEESVIEKPEENLPIAVHLSKESKSGPIVQTEIGELPGDLWELIDEPMPESAGLMQEQSILANPASRELTSSLPIPMVRHQEQPRIAKSVAVEPPPTRKAVKPTMIQMQVDATTMPQVSSTDSGQAPSAPSESQIEELARKIYSEVRKKLRFDWERFRNR